MLDRKAPKPQSSGRKTSLAIAEQVEMAKPREGRRASVFDDPAGAPTKERPVSVAVNAEEQRILAQALAASEQDTVRARRAPSTAPWAIGITDSALDDSDEESDTPHAATAATATAAVASAVAASVAAGAGAGACAAAQPSGKAPESSVEARTAGGTLRAAGPSAERSLRILREENELLRAENEQLRQALERHEVEHQTAQLRRRVAELEAVNARLVRENKDMAVKLAGGTEKLRAFEKRMKRLVTQTDEVALQVQIAKLGRPHVDVKATTNADYAGWLDIAERPRDPAAGLVWRRLFFAVRDECLLAFESDAHRKPLSIWPSPELAVFLAGAKVGLPFTIIALYKSSHVNYLRCADGVEYLNWFAVLQQLVGQRPIEPPARPSAELTAACEERIASVFFLSRGASMQSTLRVRLARGKSWKQRYVMAVGRRLYLFASPDAIKPSESLCVVGFSIAELGLMHGEVFVFSVSHPGLREYLFAAQSQAELSAWLGALRAAADLTPVPTAAAGPGAAGASASQAASSTAVLRRRLAPLRKRTKRESSNIDPAALAALADAPQESTACAAEIVAAPPAALPSDESLRLRSPSVFLRHHGGATQEMALDDVVDMLRAYKGLPPRAQDVEASASASDRDSDSDSDSSASASASGKTWRKVAPSPGTVEPGAIVRTRLGRRTSQCDGVTGDDDAGSGSGSGSTQVADGDGPQRMCSDS